jgi:hypothetical protein
VRRTLKTTLGGFLAVSVLLTAGCFQEDLREVDLTGTLRIPIEFATRSADLGAVYIGVYAAADATTLGFTYPFMGPVVGSNSWGDSYPYGGTSVGHFSFPCVVEGKCNVVTGRYADIDDVLDTYGFGANEEPPWDAEAYWDVCREYYGFTQLDELQFVGADRLDFWEQDGFYVAHWKIWHVDPQDDAAGRPVLWAFVDNGHQTCNPDGGTSNRQDGPYFREGEVFPDVLNMPGKYLINGDLYSGEPVSLEVDKRDGYDVVVDQVFGEGR